MTGSVPTGPLQNGEVWTLAQWTAAWQSKADDAYTAPFTGAVATTVPKKLAQSVSVLDFGADPTGVADSTAAIQAAINAVILLGGGIVFFPRGFYIVSSTINITNSVWLQGAGRGYTIIEWASTTLTVFAVATNNPIYMTAIRMAGPALATAGRMVQLNSGGTQNLFSIIRDCEFDRGFSHVYTLNTGDIVIENNYFNAFVQSGVHIENAFNPDSGDSTVCFNTFSNSPNLTTSVCVEQFSSGGLKILSNKMDSGAYGIQLVMASGINTSDLIIVGNSIENAAVSAINISSSGGGAIYTNIDISGNQIALTPAPISVTLTYSATSGLVIGANRINIGTTASAVAISVTWTSGVSINANTITSGAASQTAITTDVHTSGNIGINTYTGTWTQKITNLSGSVYINAQTFLTGQTTPTVTCSTTFGSLFEGTVAVTFPVAYDAPPIVVCAPGTISGGISAFPFAITKSGFTIQAYSVTNGGSGIAQYSVQGVI